VAPLATSCAWYSTLTGTLRSPIETALHQTQCDSVVRQCFSLASVIFRDAVRHRLLEISPMARVSRPKVPPPSPKFLEEHEVKAVVEACVASGDPRALAVVLMARLGLRRNEALGLIWNDLDLEAGVLNVTMQLGRTTDNAQLIRRELKTLTSKRTLRISGQLLDLLRQVESSRALCGFETDFLITLDGRGPTDPDAMSRWLAGIGKSLNIHVTPHRLRHSAATLMLNHGVPLEAVGRVLGHGDLKTTAVYARVIERSMSWLKSSTVEQLHIRVGSICRLRKVARLTVKSNSKTGCYPVAILD